MGEILDKAPSVVQIDELNLDRECIRLPSDYLKFAHASAEMKRALDAVNREADVVKADLSLRVRKDPEKYGIEKVTEDIIKATVTSHARMKEVLDRASKAQYDYDLVQAVVWALEHKKRSLTLLVNLHGMGYFSDPKFSREGKEAVEKMTQKNVRRKFQTDDND